MKILSNDFHNSLIKFFSIKENITFDFFFSLLLVGCNTKRIFQNLKKKKKLLLIASKIVTILGR